MSIETDVWQNGIVARLPESPRRLNVHWSSEHLINSAAETVQLNIADCPDIITADSL
jgi:hypothetical protein